jgi:hypothetical protein
MRVGVGLGVNVGVGDDKGVAVDGEPGVAVGAAIISKASGGRVASPGLGGVTVGRIVSLFGSDDD